MEGKAVIHSQGAVFLRASQWSQASCCVPKPRGEPSAMLGEGTLCWGSVPVSGDLASGKQGCAALAAGHTPVVDFADVPTPVGLWCSFFPCPAPTCGWIQHLSKTASTNYSGHNSSNKSRENNGKTSHGFTWACILLALLSLPHQGLRLLNAISWVTRQRKKKKKNRSGFPRCPHRNLGDTPRCLPPAGIVRGGCPTTHILTAHLVKRRVSWKQWWGLYVTRRDRVRFGVTVITTQPPRCHGSRTQVRPVVLLQALPDPRVLQQSPSAVVLYKQLLQGQKYIELDNIYFIFGFSKQIFAILEIFCKFRFMIIIFHTVAITVTTENLLR